MGGPQEELTYQLSRCSGVLPPGAAGEGFGSSALITLGVPQNPAREGHHIGAADLEVAYQPSSASKAEARTADSSSALLLGASKSRKVQTSGWVAEAEEDTSTRPILLTNQILEGHLGTDPQTSISSLPGNIEAMLPD
jgi:hypothetical protein